MMWAAIATGGAVLGVIGAVAGVPLWFTCINAGMYGFAVTLWWHR